MGDENVSREMPATIEPPANEPTAPPSGSPSVGTGRAWELASEMMHLNARLERELEQARRDARLNDCAWLQRVIMLKAHLHAVLILAASYAVMLVMGARPEECLVVVPFAGVLTYRIYRAADIRKELSADG